MSKKPDIAAIRAAKPLSVIPLCSDRLAWCNVCGRPSEELSAWRAHDERDKPIAGTNALVFIGVGSEHTECRTRMEKHPRLFAEVTGGPGHFPLLCGPCKHRSGVACGHPDLKANGGKGLQLTLSDPFRGAIICGANGRIRPNIRAMTCAGRQK